jgi:hypothetical protein
MAHLIAKDECECVSVCARERKEERERKGEQETESKEEVQATACTHMLHAPALSCAIVLLAAVSFIPYRPLLVSDACNVLFLPALHK